ncbi:hypothetical protein Tco_0565798 [Tanacetum coccineum]
MLIKKDSEIVKRKLKGKSIVLKAKEKEIYGEEDDEKVKDETCLVAHASSEGVDLDCAKCHALKIENEKLKEESTRLNKFEKSTHCLNEMLSNQKPSGDKLGLGFNSFEASSSGTKKIKFVKAQKKAYSDGGPINMGGPLNDQAAPKIIMGPPPATPESEKTVKVGRKSLNMTFDETPPPSKTSPLVDDDLDEEEAIKVTEKKNLENNIMDETLKIDEIVNIKESRNHPLENVIGN